MLERMLQRPTGVARPPGTSSRKTNPLDQLPLAPTKILSLVGVGPPRAGVDPIHNARVRGDMYRAHDHAQRTKTGYVSSLHGLLKEDC